ncbi:tripartite tricarboxylate transporter substrate binding protein [Xylophilus sp. GOD-11R]|uniref:Bug family tripartite tricarboxylate transporter substrate binding protein n=1 Tax=Xylophilus sp. GOD-11R TaxID=3089814 RepID=UPI00298CAC82|nr:tripartite tricarboxylate transporter substrate binding protein [Xylophilus sp. GOD-11R]WPB55866.1 tripartite tricarboxylate transporter substrate binding protein [Xylophilus sp. GOD-11R]
MKTTFYRGVAVVLTAFCAAGATWASDAYPSKPIKIIVTSAPGGLLDNMTRLVARQMGDKLGQPVIIENRVGAGGLVAIRGAKSSPADGYTLLASMSTIAIQPAVMQEPGYDLLKDFTGVGSMLRTPLLMMVAPSQGAKNMGELVAEAKSQPGKISYASAGIGTSTHIGPALFLQRANVDMMHVPYKGNASAWPDVISGRVSMIFEPYGSAAPMMRDNRLKPLAVSSSHRLEALPDVPTIAEQGLPNFSYYIWAGLFAPTGTPKDAIQKLSVALQAALNSPDMKERMRTEGSEALTMPPDEFNQFVVRESASIFKAVTDLKIPKQ